MKKSIPAIIACILMVTGCKQAGTRPEKSGHPAIPVTVAPARIGRMINYIGLNATSTFLFKSIIKAPVTGFIENILVNQGDAVGEGQLLFTIRTKEGMAVKGDSLQNLNFRGVIQVNAVTAGLISSIEHPRGDYVAEGDQLCQIVMPGSLVFVLDVPFELSGAVKLNAECDIALPDSQVVRGIIKSRLPSMESNSQTERYIVRLAAPKSLPENLVGKIRIVKESVNAAIGLPKSAILSDETMDNFWVMKLMNDTMAVKVPVNLGISENDYVQVTRPVFAPSDLFLTSGNYGLGDTAYVKVFKTTGHEQ
jgi:hypothetical protein